MALYKYVYYYFLDPRYQWSRRIWKQKISSGKCEEWHLIWAVIIDQTMQLHRTRPLQTLLLLLL